MKIKVVNEVSFFTPIRYERKESCWQYLYEGIEGYFYLGGKSAYVIPGQGSAESLEVEIKNKDKNMTAHVILCAIKIATYITILIPAVMLCFKIIFRTTHTFHVKNNPMKKIIINKHNQTTNVNRPSSNDTSVASLMNLFTDSWKQKIQKFELPKNYFDADRFTKTLSNHAKIFRKENFNEKEHFGYIEKFDLEKSEKPQIYVRADLHGDLKSLIENLRSLQKQKLLGKDYKCKPGVHLVFLGDYCDAGHYIVQVLEVLMRLREENRGQVHLIRGNHENHLFLNREGGTLDPYFMKIIESNTHIKALTDFYETLPLSIYFSVNGDKREYVQCTHGLFEPTMDPAPLLDLQKSGGHLLVEKERKLSARIKKIAEGDSNLSKTAKGLENVISQSTELTSPDFTAYNWADVTKGNSEFGNVGGRNYKLNAQDIRYYLDLSSEDHRVVMLFRGHQHEFQHLMYKDEVLVTTLSVGMNSKYGTDPKYKDTYGKQSDRAYIIQLEDEVSKWTKKAIIRNKSSSKTTEITASHLLTSSVI